MGAPDVQSRQPRVLLTRVEAARALGMSLSHFKRHVQPHVRVVPSGQLRLIPRADVERWADEQADRSDDAGRSRGAGERACGGSRAA